jgi:ABC-2 type transport system ATP-binding protein
MNDITDSIEVSGDQETPVVEVNDLKKLYGKVVALEDVALQVASGTIFGLVGPNGAGKTTLIKALVGVLRPTSGSVKVLGLDPIQQRWDLRRQIGYMPQNVALYSDLSARANIFFFSRSQPVPNLQANIDQILDFTELTERADDPISTFSGGMQKRVSLACALVHQPKIIFLDEPTAAVDPHLRHRTWRLFRELAAGGGTIFISTHMMEEALLCDRVAVLRRGKIIVDDSPDHILESGRAQLAVNRHGQLDEQNVPASPEGLASGLRNYGLAPDVDSVNFKPDSLEDVILAIIRDQERQ